LNDATYNMVYSTHAHFIDSERSAEYQNVLILQWRFVIYFWFCVSTIMFKIQKNWLSFQILGRFLVGSLIYSIKTVYNDIQGTKENN